MQCTISWLFANLYPPLDDGAYSSFMGKERAANTCRGALHLGTDKQNTLHIMNIKLHSCLQCSLDILGVMINLYQKKAQGLLRMTPLVMVIVMGSLFLLPKT